jgi:hypothetical protein
MVARSGIIPVYQKRKLTVRYVEIATTSKTSGDWKLGHRFRWFGYGSIQYTNQTRPRWMSGNSPAIITAKIVIASELLEMVVLQDARKRNKMAEMSVPEWAIPTQKTKFVR